MKIYYDKQCTGFHSNELSMQLEGVDSNEISNESSLLPSNKSSSCSVEVSASSSELNLSVKLSYIQQIPVLLIVLIPFS